MKKNCFLQAPAVIASLSIALSINANGMNGESARSLGMGDSYMTIANGCDGAALNPANLASTNRSAFTLKLFSLSGRVANNAFSLKDYNKYNGAYLTESDKQDILAKIPNEGLSIDFAANASALSFSVGSFAVTNELIGGGKGSLPKDPIELALMGNKVGAPVTADGSGGEGWGAASVGVSYGAGIGKIAGMPLAAGITVKYFRGLGYFNAENISASAVTLETGIQGAGGLTTVQSLGGTGYGLDFGLAAEGAHTHYGFVVKNLLASINWNRDLEKNIYNFTLSNVTAENVDDSVWHSTQETVSQAPFSTQPPMEIQFGASRNFGKLLVAGDFKQGMSNSAFVSKTPRIAGGVEYPLISLLALRSGLAFGGSDGTSGSAGLGLVLGPVHLDAAYASAGRTVPWGGRGGQFALSTILVF